MQRNARRSLITAALIGLVSGLVSWVVARRRRTRDDLNADLCCC